MLRPGAAGVLALAGLLALAGCTTPGSGAGHDVHMDGDSSSADASTEANAADVMFAQMMIPHHEQAVGQFVADLHLPVDNVVNGDQDQHQRRGADHGQHSEHAARRCGGREKPEGRGDTPGRSLIARVDMPPEGRQRQGELCRGDGDQRDADCGPAARGTPLVREVACACEHC